ncbi:hypothetical protein VPHD292_0066 [Vibrio phage D292]
MSEQNKEIVIPEFCKDSPLYSLYLLLEAMPPEPDDKDDLRMHRLYTIVETSLPLQISPEAVLEQMGIENVLEDLTTSPLGDIPIKVVD